MTTPIDKPDFAGVDEDGDFVMEWVRGEKRVILGSEGRELFVLCVAADGPYSESLDLKSALVWLAE